LKKVLIRGTAEYCKWLPRVPRHPGGNHCLNQIIILHIGKLW